MCNNCNPQVEEDLYNDRVLKHKTDALIGSQVFIDDSNYLCFFGVSETDCGQISLSECQIKINFCPVCGEKLEK